MDRPAIRHGIARALLKFDANLRPQLKAEGFLTRDPRERERKKYGQPGARKRFQFSKVNRTGKFQTRWPTPAGFLFLVYCI